LRSLTRARIRFVDHGFRRDIKRGDRENYRLRCLTRASRRRSLRRETQGFDLWVAALAATLKRADRENYRLRCLTRASSRLERLTLSASADTLIATKKPARHGQGRGNCD